MTKSQKRAAREYWINFFNGRNNQELDEIIHACEYLRTFVEATND